MYELLHFLEVEPISKLKLLFGINEEDKLAITFTESVVASPIVSCPSKVKSPPIVVLPVMFNEEAVKAPSKLSEPEFVVFVVRISWMKVFHHFFRRIFYHHRYYPSTPRIPNWK